MTPNMILQRWREKYAHHTVYNLRLALRTLLRNIEHLRGTDGLVSTLTKVRTPDPRTVIATPQQIHQLISKSEPWMRCFLLLCADLALRSGTAARVAPQHYFAEQQVIRIASKGRKQIELPVSPELRKLFEMAPPADPTTPFWQSLRNPEQPTASHDVLARRWERLKKQCGVPKEIHFHDLRRTVAVRTLDKTGDIRDVSAVLGHTNLRATFAYLEHRDTAAIRRHLASLWWTPRKKEG